MPGLRCRNVCKSFDGVRALADLNLELHEGGITAIIGPNGAGKTTLLNVLTGFLRPDSGRCFLGDREITGLAPYEISRHGVARSFQELRLIRHVSVLENVLLARPGQSGEKLLSVFRFRRLADEERRHRDACFGLLETVGLAHKANRLAAELSYGEQKLLSLACCLATEAKVLLLDEPVAGLNPEARAAMLGLVQGLSREGSLVALVEHDLDAVQKVANSVIVMSGGRVIAEGAPSDVLAGREILEAYLG